jgi:hypothetical protein
VIDWATAVFVSGNPSFPSVRHYRSDYLPIAKGCQVFGIAAAQLTEASVAA